MKSVIVCLLVCAPLIIFADVTSFVFTSASALSLGERQTVTVQSQNSSSEKENISSTTCVEIRSTSSSGKLFSSSSAIDPVSVLVLTMSKGTANKNFYYEDMQAGTYNFNLKASYRPEEEKRTCANWPVSEWGNTWSATQGYTVGSTVQNSGNEEGTSGSSNNVPEESGTASSVNTIGITSSFPVDPQVFSEIKAPKTVVVGAQFFVSGEGYGLEKKPLENARYFWNFGDGTTKEGKSVAHTYRNIGEYALVLDISSGKFAGSSKQVVSVVKSPLVVSKVIPGDSGFIEIKNESGSEFDVSGWMVDISGNRFSVPRNTFILSKGTLTLHREALGFTVGNSASLLYPNGGEASSYVGAVQKVVHSNSASAQNIRKNDTSISNRVVSDQKKSVSEVLSHNKTLTAQVLASEEVVPSPALDNEVKNISSSNYWWFVAFVALIVIASGSVFFIKQPKQSFADEFTIEEQ